MFTAAEEAETQPKGALHQRRSWSRFSWT